MVSNLVVYALIVGGLGLFTLFFSLLGFKKLFLDTKAGFEFKNIFAVLQCAIGFFGATLALFIALLFVFVILVGG